MPWLVIGAIVLALVVVRLCGYLTRQIAREATRWCGVCGLEIAEGWVLFELVPAPDDTRGDGQKRRTPVYYCLAHRPADAHATPWHG